MHLSRSLKTTFRFAVLITFVSLAGCGVYPPPIIWEAEVQEFEAQDQINPPPENAIVVIDDDMGRSASSARGRTGFARLVADVGLKRAGIIFGLEVSRLARNNRDWYQLLDLCSMTDTLIADIDGVYNPCLFNDRLLLGLKGTMSEAELHLIKSRMHQGLFHKAQKGELRLPLPAGYQYDTNGKIIKSLDEQITHVIDLTFTKFFEIGSVHGVVKFFLRKTRSNSRARPSMKKRSAG